MHKDLAIITVVFENYTILQDFFKSINKQKNKNFNLIIVDTSKNRKKITLPKNSELILSLNHGYAAAVNLGLKKAIGKKITKFCILNSDVYFESDFVNNILTALEKHRSAIIGGKIYYAPGFEYHKRYKESDLGKVIWYAGGQVDKKHGLTPHVGVDEVDKGQHDKEKKTEFVNGCLMCLDQEVISKIGYWDKSYFLYFEDADYCERSKKKGIKLYYDPQIVIWHKNAQSTGGAGSKIHSKYQEINRLRFGLKYMPLRTKLHLMKNFLFLKSK